MEPWKQKIEQSQARVKCTEMLALVKKFESEYDIANPEQDYLDRATLVGEAVSAKLNNTDPRLINIQTLESLGSTLEAAIGNLNNWVTTNDPVNLTANLDGNLNTIVALLTDLSPSTNAEEARDSITTLRRSVARHRTIVENLIKDISEKGSLADKTVDEKLQEAVSGFEKLQAEVTDLENELTNVKNSSTQVTTEQQTAFTKAEADRSTAFTALVSEKQKELEQSIKTHSDEVQQSLKAIRKKIEDDETSVVEARERVEEILEIVGDDALIGDYSKNAKAELNAADLWRWIAVGSLAIAIIVATIFAFMINGDTPWQRVVAKIVIVASFAGLTGYAAKQSSEHREAQRSAESMALQLKAIKPYLGDITDKAKQDDLLVKIAGRLFGKKIIKKQRDHGKKNENPLVIGQLAEAILDLVKKAK